MRARVGYTVRYTCTLRVVLAALTQRLVQASRTRLRAMHEPRVVNLSCTKRNLSSRRMDQSTLRRMDQSTRRIDEWTNRPKDVSTKATKRRMNEWKRPSPTVESHGAHRGGGGTGEEAADTLLPDDVGQGVDDAGVVAALGGGQGSVSPRAGSSSTPRTRRYIYSPGKRRFRSSNHIRVFAVSSNHIRVFAVSSNHIRIHVVVGYIQSEALVVVRGRFRGRFEAG